MIVDQKLAIERNPMALPGAPVFNGYETLTKPIESRSEEGVFSFEPDAYYDQYLRMHKVFVGYQGAEQLENIYEALREDVRPKHLSAAGWSAIETALIRSDRDPEERLALLDGAGDCFVRALDTQRWLNGAQPELPCDYAYPHRIALDIAVLPLLRGLVEGTIDPRVRREVLRDCLNIAQSNAMYTKLMAQEGNTEGIGEFSGFGYECNALLGFNLRCTKGWFVIPSMARCDTGYHHRQQTHDLTIVHHRNGRLLNATPVEIKAAASARDRQRYKALLVRGKMHLSEPGNYRPDDTLAAIEAVYEGRPTSNDVQIFANVTNRFVEMVKDYCAGEQLGKIATKRSVTRFRDNTQVVANHPGLNVAI